MRWFIAFFFLSCVSQIWSGSLLGHVRLVDDNGRRQDPQMLAFGFSSLNTAEHKSRKSKVHKWFIEQQFKPHILVINTSDTVEFYQHGMPIKDLLILGSSRAYRTGNRKRVTSLDFSKNGYYQIEEHSAPGVLGRLYVDQNDFIVRPDKRGLLKMEDIPHGFYRIYVYNNVHEVPLKLDVTILEKETTALRINLNHKILRREGQ